MLIIIIMHTCFWVEAFCLWISCSYNTHAPFESSFHSNNAVRSCIIIETIYILPCMLTLKLFLLNMSVLLHAIKQGCEFHIKMYAMHVRYI